MLPRTSESRVMWIWNAWLFYNVLQQSSNKCRIGVVMLFVSIQSYWVFLGTGPTKMMGLYSYDPMTVKALCLERRWRLFQAHHECCTGSLADLLEKSIDTMCHVYSGGNSWCDLSLTFQIWQHLGWRSMMIYQQIQILRYCIDFTFNVISLWWPSKKVP